MDIVLVALLLILIVLVIFLLLKGNDDNLESQIDASLKKQFLDFQSNINRDLSSTRDEINRSKDLISDHTLKTMETIKNMGQTVNKIIQQQEESQKLSKSLKDLLQPPKLRGNYGEVILEELLERVLPKGIWQRQYTIDEGQKVDAVIILKETIVPIDAKFPRDDYQRYIEASDSQEKKLHWKNYETALKNQIKSISTKYIKPEKGTTDFAFMFIPSEAIYYETVADKNHLGEESSLYSYAQEHKVVPVSPNSFYAHLQTVVMGFKNVEILRGAKKLREGLVSVEKSFERFYGKYEDIGKHLEKAQEAYRIGNTHIGSYKKNLDSTLKLDGINLKEEKALEETTLN